MLTDVRAESEKLYRRRYRVIVREAQLFKVDERHSFDVSKGARSKEIMDRTCRNTKTRVVHVDTWSRGLDLNSRTTSDNTTVL